MTLIRATSGLALYLAMVALFQGDVGGALPGMVRNIVMVMVEYFLILWPALRTKHKIRSGHSPLLTPDGGRNTRGDRNPALMSTADA